MILKSHMFHDLIRDLTANGNRRPNLAFFYRLRCSLSFTVVQALIARRIEQDPESHRAAA